MSEATVLAFRQRKAEEQDRVDVLRDITGIEGDRVHVTLEASGLAKRSKSIYRRAIERFEQWHGAMESLDIEEYDAILAKYAYHLHKSNLAPKSVRLQTTCLRFFLKQWYRLNGPWPLLENSMRVINREGRSRGRKQRDGISWQDVELMARVSLAPGRKRYNAVRDAAMVRVMSDGLLRASELVGIKVEHLTFKSDGTATLLIPFSKSDQDGEGKVKFLGQPTVKALREWMLFYLIEEGYIFLSVGGKSTGKPMSVQAVRNAVKSLAALAGIEGEIGSHSFRIGSAQELVRAGASLLEVQQAGGWADSAMPSLYTRNEKASLTGVARVKYGL